MTRLTTSSSSGAEGSSPRASLPERRTDSRSSGTVPAELRIRASAPGGSPQPRWAQSVRLAPPPRCRPTGGSWSAERPSRQRARTSRSSGFSAFPRVSIRGDSRLEGDRGERLRFPIRLSEPPGTTPVDVSYATVERSAVAPQDYLSDQGELRFSGARTLRWVRVVVFGDRRVEPNERFRVRISVVGNATLGRTRATGRIRNDD